jgi:hypothetical protein
MKKNYTNQATKSHASLYSESGPKSKVAPNYKRGGEDPPKRSPFAAVQAPTGGISTPAAPTKEQIVKENSAKYKKTPNYNRVDISKAANKTENPNATRKAMEKQKKTTWKESVGKGEMSRSDYMDSLTTLKPLGVSRKEVRQEMRSDLGRTDAAQVVKNIGKGTKKVGKNVVAGVKKAYKAAKKACSRSGGSCNAKRNKTLGGKF